MLSCKPVPVLRIVAVGWLMWGCGDVVTVATPHESERGETLATCEAALPACVLDRCDDACPGGPAIDPNSSCACCRSGPLPSDIEATFDLRVDGAGLDAISGRAVFATAGLDHDKDAQVYARTLVCGGRIELVLEGMVPAASAGLAAFIDMNDDGLCDSEIDRGLDVSVFGVSEDVEIEITPEVLGLNSELVCQHFGYYLWVRGYDFPNEGAAVAVRLRDGASAEGLAERVATTALDAGLDTMSFFAEFHAPLLGSRSYLVDVLLDLDADGSCDPTTERAWRKPLGPVTGSEAVHVSFEEAPNPAACEAFKSEL